MIARVFAQKILWSTWVQYLGKAIQVGLGILITHKVTDALGPESYGIYGKITEYCLFFSSLAGLGIFGNTMRALADQPQDGRMIWNAWIVRALSAGLILGTGVVYAKFSIQNAFFEAGTLIFMGALWIDYLSSIAAATFQANYWMGRFTILQVSGRLLELLLVQYVAEHHPSGLYFLAAQLANGLWVLVVSIVVIQRHIQIDTRINMELMKALFLGSIPLGIINIVNNLYYRFLPSYYMSELLSNAEYGRYNVLLIICAQLALLSTFLMFSALPILKQSIDEGHAHRVRELLNKTSKGLGILGVIMIISGSLLGPHLIHWISSDTFSRGELYQMLPIMLLITALSWLYDFVLIALFTLNEERWFLKQEVGALILGATAMQLSPSPVWILLSACSAMIFSVSRGLHRIRHISLKQTSQSGIDLLKP